MGGIVSAPLEATEPVQPQFGHPTDHATSNPLGDTWAFVQSGLAQIANQTLGRFGPGGEVISPLSRDNPICALMRNHAEAGPRCTSQCDQGVQTSIQTGRTQLFQCHAKLSVFIAPYHLSGADTSDSTETLLGGKVFLSYEDIHHFRDYAAELGISTSDLEPLAPDLTVLPLPTIKGFLEHARNIAEAFAGNEYDRSRVQAQNERLRYLMEIFSALDSEPAEELPLAVLHGLGILFDAPAGMLLKTSADSDTMTVMETFSGNSAHFSEDELRAATISTRLPWMEKALIELPTQAFDSVYDLLRAGFPAETTRLELFTIPSAPHPFTIALLNTPLSDEDRTAIGIFCRHAGLLMEKETLATQLDRELPSLPDQLPIWDTTNLSELAHGVLEQVVTAVGAEQGSIMLVDAQQERMQIQAIHGLHLKYVEYVRIRKGEGISGSVWAEGAPLLVPDIERHPELSGQRRSRYRSRSFISLPIRFGKRIYGVINVADKQGGAAFDGHDLRRLMPIAQQAALAIDRIEARHTADTLRTASMTDYLTGLLNRGAFDQRIREEVERARRYPYANPLSLLVVDIDDFKKVNDTYGLLTGDDCIRACAQTLKAGVRNIDAVFRRGGEEFTVLLPHTSREAALTLAERLCQSMASMTVVSKHTPNPVSMTISIGLATFPDDGDTDDALFKRANQALHLAKSGGKNQVVTLPPEPEP